MEKKDICDSFNKALDLELEGYEFYTECAKHTENEEGKQMFRHLAQEEEDHMERVAEIYHKKFEDAYCDYQERDRTITNVFQEKVKGGNLDEKSNAIDALNIGIKAEENSIQLYKKMQKKAEDEEVEKFFRKLVDEEKKHRMILEEEIEYLTETGSFHDFKVVTS